MKLSAIIKRIRTDCEHLGFFKTAYAILMEAINVFVTFRVIRVLEAVRVDPKFLKCDLPLTWEFFSEDRLLEFAKNPENKLSEEFVRNAIERGDKCYGARNGDELAATGWYSNQPTDDEGILVNFSPEYVYMYAGFTHPKYRGQRLHAIGMTRALQAFLDEGYKGLISYVNSHNFKSLHSASRMDYRTVGTIVALKLGKLLLSWSTRGCRQVGFYLSMPKPAAEVREPALAT
jgi:hypothetical protein